MTDTQPAEVAPCHYCGEPKPIKAWCASEECAERVEAAQAAERSFIRGEHDEATK